MNRSEAVEHCNAFFEKLASCLSGRYEIVGSCNADNTRYLVPIGTAEDITYYGKPMKSFRVSDHWTWYANTEKCSNESYIQCLNVDTPWAKKRKSPGKASSPIWAVSVSVVNDSGKYHVIYGEKYCRKTKTWSWVEADPELVAMTM